MDGTARLAIGKLAKHTGTNVETIRYYERMGLWAAPSRSEGGYRLYGTEHLKRLNFIRRARLLGFSIGEVRTLLRLADERRRPCAEVRSVADAHLADVRDKIADLRTMERVLKETVARCAEGAGSHCPLIDALYRDGAPDHHARNVGRAALRGRRVSQPMAVAPENYAAASGRHRHRRCITASAPAARSSARRRSRRAPP